MKKIHQLPPRKTFFQYFFLKIQFYLLYNLFYNTLIQYNISRKVLLTAKKPLFTIKNYTVFQCFDPLISDPRFGYFILSAGSGFSYGSICTKEIFKKESSYVTVFIFNNRFFVKKIRNFLCFLKKIHQNYPPPIFFFRNTIKLVIQHILHHIYTL